MSRPLQRLLVKLGWEVCSLFVSASCHVTSHMAGCRLTFVGQRHAVLRRQRRVHGVVQPVGPPLDAGASLQGGLQVPVPRAASDHVLDGGPGTQRQGLDLLVYLWLSCAWLVKPPMDRTRRSTPAQDAVQQVHMEMFTPYIKCLVLHVQAMQAAAVGQLPTWIASGGSASATARSLPAADSSASSSDGPGTPDTNQGTHHCHHQRVCR